MGARDIILGALPYLKGLPPFPQIVLRLDDACSKPDVGSQSIAEIIEEDPALVARFLRVANSSFYATTTGVTTIRQAILRIGVQETRRIATATVLVSRLVQSGPVLASDLWRHSLAVAFASEYIARRSPVLPEQDAKEAFTAGLLHDIGALALMHVAPDEYASAEAWARDHSVPLVEAERMCCGIDHVELGGALMTQWQLPETLIQVLDAHHQTGASGLVAVVRAADLVCGTLGYSRCVDQPVAGLTDDDWNLLGLRDDDVDAVVAGVASEGARSETFLSLIR